jgi:hypothetical protein
MTRKEKKQAKVRRKQNCRRRFWERCAVGLDCFGLGDGFRALKEGLKDGMTSVCLPMPEMNTGPLGQVAGQVRDAIMRDLDASTVQVGNSVLPWPETYKVVCPLIKAFRDMEVGDERLPSLSAQYFRRAKMVCKECPHAVWNQTMNILWNAVANQSALISDLTSRIGWYLLEPHEFGISRHGHRITMGWEPCQRVEVELDGSRRPAYRCGGDPRCGGFRWISWPREILGLHGGPKRLAVYIQRHALERLHQRLAPLKHAAVQRTLIYSLAKPVLTSEAGENPFLVEYRLGAKMRVGHLVGRLVEDKVLFTTFLFLTMQGTPEAKLLAERLRLRRADIEYTGLDTLGTFINSDLAKDAELREAFTEAGCGDLLKLQCSGAPDKIGDSAMLRQYIGFGVGKNGPWPMVRRKPPPHKA